MPHGTSLSPKMGPLESWLDVKSEGKKVDHPTMGCFSGQPSSQARTPYIIPEGSHHLWEKGSPFSLFVLEIWAHSHSRGNRIQGRALPLSDSLKNPPEKQKACLSTLFLSHPHRIQPRRGKKGTIRERAYKCETWLAGLQRV